MGHIFSKSAAQYEKLPSPKVSEGRGRDHESRSRYRDAIESRDESEYGDPRVPGGYAGSASGRSRNHETNPRDCVPRDFYDEPEYDDPRILRGSEGRSHDHEISHRNRSARASYDEQPMRGGGRESGRDAPKSKGKRLYYERVYGPDGRSRKKVKRGYESLNIKK